MTQFTVTDGQHSLPIDVISHTRDSDGSVLLQDIRIGGVPVEPGLFLADWVIADLEAQVRRHDDDMDRFAREWAEECGTTC